MGVGLESREAGLEMKRGLTLFVFLLAVWLLLSGHYTPTLITYDVLSCLAVEALPAHLGIRPLLYLPWLLKEIVLSNLSVARVILTPSLPIRPRILRVEASQRSDVGRVTYANSITLTPGTITLDVRDGEMLVHALTAASAEGLLSGDMNRRVSKLEGLREEAP
jgi:multicomponent Na+:H+ antiporter subunit E